jgi:hypothetical protein
MFIVILATRRVALGSLCAGALAILAILACADGRQSPTSPSGNVPVALASMASDEGG